MIQPQSSSPLPAKSSRHILTASAATLFALVALPGAQAQITLPGSTTYTQNFDSLGTATAPWVDNTTLPGWYAGINFPAIADGNLTIANGSDATLTGLLNLGTAGAADRALGSKATGTNGFANIAYGVVFQNTGTRTLDITNIGYAGELWLSNGTAAAPELWFTFTRTSATQITDPEPGATGTTASTGNVANTFTAAPTALNWSSPSTANTGVITTGLNGNLAANRTVMSADPNVLVPAGQYFMFRWVDTNTATTDGYQGIDDFSITFANTDVYNLAHTVGGSPNGTLEVSATTYFVDGAAGVGFSNGDAVTFSQLGTATIAVPADVNPAATTVSAGSGAYTIGGAGKIGGPLVKSNAGTLILTSPNNFSAATISGGVVEAQATGAIGTGTVTFNTGTLRIRDNGAGDNGTLAYGNNVTVTTSSTLDLDRATGGTSVGNTVAFGNLAVGSQTLTVTGANGYKARFDGAVTLTGNPTILANSEVILQGAITGNFGISKTGTGRLVINSIANTYTGNTSVNAGSIGGTGATGGQLIVASGATLAPGDGVGTFATKTTLNLQLGSIFAVELAHGGGATPVAGTDYDQMKVGTGTGVTSTGTVTLGGGELVLTLGTGVQAGDLFFIILNDGTDAVAGTPGTFNGLAQGATLPGGQFRISYTADSVAGTELNGNDVALIALAVPEPGTALLALFGAATLLRGRRRRG